MRLVTGDARPRRTGLAAAAAETADPGLQRRRRWRPGSRGQLGHSARAGMRGCGDAARAQPVGESAGGGRRGPGRWRRGRAAAPRPGSAPAEAPGPASRGIRVWRPGGRERRGGGRRSRWARGACEEGGREGTRPDGGRVRVPGQEWASGRRARM